MPNNVVVNLNINANATGIIDVFGQAQPSLAGCNVLIANTTLPVSDLYVGSNNALIKFQGSNDDILATRDTSFTTLQATLMNDLAAVINGSFNCSNASPFSLSKYSNVYNTQANFGYVTLACYADKLFGHVAATAAIDNDTGLISYMTSNGSGGANISSNLAASVFALTNTNATAIAKQVIGQDASRAKNQDNDQAAPNLYQSLQFVAGDVIYMSTTIQPPTVTYGTGQKTSLSNVASDTSYLLRITLGAAAAPAPAPAFYIYFTDINNNTGNTILNDTTLTIAYNTLFALTAKNTSGNTITPTTLTWTVGNTGILAQPYGGNFPNVFRGADYSTTTVNISNGTYSTTITVQVTP